MAEDEKVGASFSLLPSEIIGQIVLHATGYALEENGSITLQVDPLEGPWSYGWICSRWRRVLLSLPNLWSQIDISQNCHPTKAPLILQTILARSNETPLTIQLFWTDEWNSTARELLQIVIQRSKFWYSISLFVPRDCMSLLPSIEGAVPILEDLHIECVESVDPIPPDVLGTAFKTAPELRRVTIQDFADPANLVLPWSQLTYFQYTSQVLISPSEELQILRNLPRLIEYSVVCGPSQDFDPSQESTIQLPYLLTLNVEDSTDPAVLECINLPALKEVDLGAGHPAYLLALSSLIEHSACVLTELTLTRYTEAGAILLELLHSVPALRELYLEYTSPSFSDLISALTVHPGQTPVVPELERLEINLANPVRRDLDLNTIVDLVNSRSTLAGLRQFAFRGGLGSYGREQPAQPILEEGALEILDKLRSEGIDLEFEIV